jgi:hypothetical protein
MKMRLQLKLLVVVLGLMMVSCGPISTPEVFIPTAITASETPPPVEFIDEIDTQNEPDDVDDVISEEEEESTLDLATQDASKSNSLPTGKEPDFDISAIGLPVPGIEMHHITSQGGLDLVKESGATWIRKNALFWSQVEPSPGERRWNALVNLETELANASEAGFETILVVRSTPRWAQKLAWEYCGPIAPEALDAFAQFMFELVEKYSAPPYNVMYWEIGNEPDVEPKFVKGNEIYGCWGDETEEYYGGEYYAEVLKVVYPKVKQANPDAQVLVGGLLLECDPRNPPLRQGSDQKKDCSSANFLEGILIQGGGDYFDGVSYHAYDYYWGAEGDYRNLNWHSNSESSGPVLIVKAAFIREILAKYDVSGKYLLNTESGILCGSTGQEGYCKTDSFRNTKAYYVAQSNAAALANGLIANVWYSIYGWRGSGLALSSTNPTTALAAFKVSADLLNNRFFVRDLAEFPGVMGYEFLGDEKMWILWASDGEAHEMQLAENPQMIVDVFGNEVEAQRQIVVSSAPIYILFP